MKSENDKKFPKQPIILLLLLKTVIHKLVKMGGIISRGAN